MPPIVRQTITENFIERVKASPSAIGFQFKPSYAEMGTVGEWKTVTFKEFYQECRIVSYGLMGLGVKEGDRVAIISNTRYEWSLCDMAILGARAVTVPIYASNTADDSVFILAHSEARVVILEDERQLQKILETRLEKPSALPHLEKIVVLEPSAVLLAARHQGGLKSVLSLQALKELGRREEARDPKRFDLNLRSAKSDDLITICYTSGTTGTPKGVMITHDNLVSVLEDCVEVLGECSEFSRDVILSFLPFSHIFGKVESMAIYTFGWRQVFAEDLDKLMSNFAEIRPTIFFSVPRIFEKAYIRIQTSLERLPLAKRKLFEKAIAVGKSYYSEVWNKKTPSLTERLEFELAKTLVFRKLSKRFGGRVKFAICGGAPLPREIGEFFQILGVQILEGYGLTETCAPVSLNTPGSIRFGAVGRPLPEVSFKIAQDGEILVKSRKIFKAYYKLPEETEKVIQGGWFHTGDIGEIDSEGYLHITDRKKDMIVTSGGKNIAPQKIENIAKSQKLITQFVVHGDRRHYLTALVTLDRDQVIRYANEHQILFSEYAELIKNPKILALVQKLMDEVNRQLAPFESIKKFVILPNDFTVEGGELTPSLKVRRTFINKHYKAELDSMYVDSVRVPLDSASDIR